MPIPLKTAANADTLGSYLGETLVHIREVRVDVAGALPWVLGFGLFGGFMVVAAVLTVQEMGLTGGALLLGAFELAMGLGLLYAAYGQIADELDKRRLKRQLTGLEVHYGLDDVAVRREGELVQTLDLARGLEHPLGRWAPAGLDRLLAMRALLVGQPADAPLRHAAEFAAWSTFDSERRMASSRVYVLRVPSTGAMGWFDPTRDEDGDLRVWHERGVPLFRVRLERARPEPGDDEPVGQLQRVTVVELPTRAEDPDELPQ